MNIYKQKSTLLALLFLFGSWWGLQAQDEEDITRGTTPAYPTTATLGTYGNIPVGMHTGSPNVNLDIYTITDGGFSVPINLTYNSNGVGVDAISGTLGIDWNFMASGAVTRQVNADDDFNSVWYTPDTTQLCNQSSTTAATTLAHPPQKDIFNYNASGISGKFILDNSGQPFQLIPNDNKIEIIYENTTGGGVNRVFKITDIGGTEYYFGEGGKKERSSNKPCGGGTPTTYDTGWFLTRIKTLTGQVALFSYISANYDSKNYYQKASSMNYGYGSGPVALGTPCYSLEHHETLFLSQVSINNKKVVLSYQDLQTNTLLVESKQLIKIEVFTDAVNTKTFDLNYYTVVPTTSYSSPYTNSAYRRYFLKEVIEWNAPKNQSIKKYSFDYYSPELLPAKYSYAKDIYGYFNGQQNTNLIYNNLDAGYIDNPFTTITTKRSPNGAKAYYGMLKTITYPTKGKTEFLYESNSVWKKRTVYPPPTGQQVGYEANSNNLTEAQSPSFTIPYAQNIKIYAESSILTGSAGCMESDITHWTPLIYVWIINVATGLDVVNFTTSTPTTVYENLPAGTYYIKIKTIRKCQQTYASVTYYDTEPYDVWENAAVGGMRVQKTLDYDNNGTTQVKRYYYGTLSELTKSTGSFATKNPEGVENVDVTASSQATRYTMFSTPKTPLNSFQGPNLTYGSVIESFGENFENGGIQHYYNATSDEQPYELCPGGYIRGTPYSSGFNGGTERKRITFKKQGATFITLNTLENIYTHDESYDWAIDNYSATQNYVSASEPIYNFNSYQVRRQLYLLSETRITNLDLNGQNPVANKVTYTYNHPVHFQVSSETSTTSVSNVNLETRYYYPKDSQVASYPHVTDLVAKNVVGAVLNVQNYRNGILTTELKTLYEVDTTTSFKPLPKYIYQKKGADTDFGFEQRLTYNKYDTKGNVLEYTVEGGIPITMVYGYNRTQPIAKVVNATYAEVLTALSTTETALQALTVAPANIRTVLPNAMITTYTYKPLIGLETVTDSKGYKISYSYDTFGRLQFVKDMANNILTENQYNFKP